MFAGPDGSVDRIADFVAAADAIVVSATGFGGGLISGGRMTLVANSVPAPAVGAGGQMRYDTGDGGLFWDADGNGRGARVQFAQLLTKPTIASTDFLVEVCAEISDLLVIFPLFPR